MIELWRQEQMNERLSASLAQDIIAVAEDISPGADLSAYNIQGWQILEIRPSGVVVQKDFIAEISRTPPYSLTQLFRKRKMVEVISYVTAREL